MSVAQRISEAEYEQIVLAEPDQTWELVGGRLREKPGISWDHNRIVMMLGHLLLRQLDFDQFSVFFESRVRRSAGTIFLPDIMVVPTDYGQEFAGRPGVLAIFSQPLPLVVEVWSASTGEYDVDMKIPEYQRRGDQEIWRIHPHEKTLTAWWLQEDGTYSESVLREGAVTLIALPSVAIALAELFDV
jgi:Uma2 family endonuclease